MIVTFVALATLATTGGFHSFLLASSSGGQVVADGLVKAGIYVGQFAVCVQVTVVIRNLQIEWQALWLKDIAGLFLVHPLSSTGIRQQCHTFVHDGDLTDGNLQIATSMFLG